MSGGRNTISTSTALKSVRQSSFITSGGEFKPFLGKDEQDYI